MAKAQANAVTTIWKPLPEEFLLDVDYASIASALNLSIDQIAWSIEEAQQDGVDGHTLTGVPA
jgi:hypothetical protein